MTAAAPITNLLGPAPQQKTRYPRALALRVAKELCDALAPVTDRLIVAGSLRRRKETVGDVEILYIPKMERISTMHQVDIFSPPPTQFKNLADEVLERLIYKATIIQRKTSIDSITWGDKNKFAVHVTTGIPVDFFAATHDNWWNYVVCRTGGADSNAWVAMAAQDRGYKWNPYGPGFTRLRDNRILRVRSERAVFAIAGRPYLEPKDR